MVGKRWRTTAATVPVLVASVRVAFGDFGDAHAFGERPGKVAAYGGGEIGLRPRPQVPRGDGGIRGKDPGQRLGGGGFGHGQSGSLVCRVGRSIKRRSRAWRAMVQTEGTRLNIILVTGATARARTVTLDWRHWAVGGFSLFVAVPRVHVHVQFRDVEVGGCRPSCRSCRS